MPRVSVVIPTRNRSALLRGAIRSAQALDSPDLEVEVVVGDNGSTDATPEVCAELGVRRVVATRLGPAAARNAALQEATGDYIAFLDDDDEYTEQALHAQVKLLESDRRLGAAVGQTVVCDGNLRPMYPPAPESLPGGRELFATWLAEYPQLGATVVRRHVAREVGPLDERLQGGEDWDWHLRLATRADVGFVPVPVVRLRIRAQRQRAAIDAERVTYLWPVFSRNYLRARGHRPSPPVAVRMLLRHMGKYADNFLTEASACIEAGDRAGARRATLLALRASPLHLAWRVVRDRGVRRRVWTTAVRRAA